MIQSLAWVGRKQYYKGRHKFPPAGERLAVTMHLFASGESQESLSYAYLIGKSTLSHIITETCDAIFEALAGEYLHPPSSTLDGKLLRKY